MKTKTYYQYVGGRGGSGDLHLMSGYGATAIVVQCVKIDAGTTGQIVGTSRLVKPFTYDNMITHNDAPARAYLWLPGDGDGGFTGHEKMTLATMTISGGAVGLATGSLLGAARYGAEFNYLHRTASAVLTTGGPQILTIAENAGQAWTFSGWIRPVSANAAEFYTEYNNGFTSDLFIFVTAAQAVSISRSNGGVGWASANGVVPLFVWSHVAITHTAGGSDQLYINGVASGGAHVGTAGAGYTTDRIALNRNQGGIVDTALAMVQNNVVYSADDMLQQYEDMTRDDLGGTFSATTANLGKLGGCTVVFSNDGPHTFDSGSYTIRLPLSPVCEIANVNGIFLLEVTTYYESEEI